MKRFLLPAGLLLLAVSANAQWTLDWDAIKHWAGHGPNRAALVVQFLDDGPEEGYVWGYRWEDGEYATGESMVRTIAAESNDLIVFTQFTGPMGSTLDGLGYSRDNAIINYIQYDYESACQDPFINFHFDAPNTLMGQTSAPGDDAITLCADAIEAAKATHIIEHPLNQHVYGYPAYDYDWWQPTRLSDGMRWNAGWYTGYWSYWLGTENSDDFVYSGLGMTSVVLKDGDVNGWKFMPLDGPVTGEGWDAISSATTPWHPLNYEHFSSTLIGELTAATDSELVERIYSINGLLVKTQFAGMPRELPAGVYVVKCGDKTEKLYIR